MKKAIALVLILTLAAALCACGEPPVIEKEVEKTVEVPVVAEEYVKYKSVLDALNAGDYNGARSLVKMRMPEPEKPPVTRVQITTENFLDYFEFVDMLECTMQYEYLSSGEPAALFVAPGYVLKEEYQVDPDHRYSMHITADVQYTYWTVHSDQMIIDFDTPSYELAYALDSFNYPEVKTETLNAYYRDPWLCFTCRYRNAILNKYANYAATLIDSVELISASGTLYLAG